MYSFNRCGVRDEYQGKGQRIARVHDRKLEPVRQGFLYRDCVRFHHRLGACGLVIFMLTERTKSNFVGVRPELVTMWSSTTFPYPCQVIDGVRSFEKQEQYYKAGTSKTLNSRHLTGHAIDFAIWPFGFDQGVSWDLVKQGKITKEQESAYYHACVKALKKSAKNLGMNCTFGADWGWDLGHIELSWDHYPLEDRTPPKTVANSKTIAAAAGGIPIVTFAEEIFHGIKKLTGNLLTGIDDSTIGAIQTVALSGIVLFIVWERYKKIKRDGV